MRRYPLPEQQPGLNEAVERRCFLSGLLITADKSAYEKLSSNCRADLRHVLSRA